MRVGEKLKKLIESGVASVEEVALIIGITRQYVYKLYKLEDNQIKLEYIKRLSDRLKVDFEYFFDDKNSIYRKRYFQLYIQDISVDKKNIEHSVLQEQIDSLKRELTLKDEIIRSKDEVIKSKDEIINSLKRLVGHEEK